MNVARSKMAMPQGVMGSIHRNTLKIFKTLQNHLAQMLESRYVALHSCP